MEHCCLSSFTGFFHAVWRRSCSVIEAHTIEGIVESIIFSNDENGFAIFSIEYEEEEMVCTGNLPFLNEGEFVTLSGKFIMHPVYGRQFNFSEYSKQVPQNAAGMVKYLGSGVIKGIGEKMAEKIVKRFGDQTFEVIENYPEKLAEIKGITLAKAEQISATFHEQAAQREAMMFLNTYGINASVAARIFKQYKEKTINVVRSNPYVLAGDIIGIGFKIADSIAYRMGFEAGDINRIKSGIRYCLNNCVANGHVYYPKDMLLKEAVELLQAPAEIVENALMELHIEKSLVLENMKNMTAAYPGAYYYAENYVAKRLMELDRTKESITEPIDEEIKAVCRELDIELAENQRKAVEKSMEGGVLVITGGPGTGKTTTINTIIRMLEKRDLEIELAAPTGRAAKRMTEATGKEAKTIHRLLEVKFISEDVRRQSFERNEEYPITADVLIIDEISMVDIILMMNLLKAVETGTRLILVGDSNQLPSVGAGNVLNDIIRGGHIDIVYLNEIFRQAKMSNIVTNAHKINKGEYPAFNGDNTDFFMVKRASVDLTADSIVDLVKNRLPKYGNYDSIKDIQVLTPMRKSRIGVLSLNMELQKVLNPPVFGKKEYEYRDIIFREGDKVMQIKNNYNLRWESKDGLFSYEEGQGVFNGDEGIIESISLLGEKMKVDFDDGKKVEYDFSQLDELDLAYAMTIHKSQGSEYKVVVIPVHSGPPMLLTRNLLYTAVTRAKNMVVLVGTEDCLKQMVDNNREIKRYSALDKKIIKFAGVLSE